MEYLSVLLSFAVFVVVVQFGAATTECKEAIQYPCFRAERRYRWNDTIGSCEAFVGCPGFGNNFDTYGACFDACALSDLSGIEFNAGDNFEADYYDTQKSSSISLPFIQEIGSQQLLDGKAIGIKGEIIGNEFWFDLADGPNQSGSVTSNYAIDVSYRRKEGWVINTKIDSEWQTEDRYPISEGIEKGREIYIRIEPYQDYFAVFANGQKIGERNYVMPLEKVAYVYVTGDLSLHQIQFEDNFYMVPFIYDLKSFDVGRSLYITGKPDKDARQFWINFRANEDNVPFQFNPRFSTEVVIRNAEKSGKWQHEDRDGTFPFVKDEVFDLIFEANEDAFKVYVNGDYLCTFYHQLPVANVNQLEIGGDVEISTIH